jgi:hypothetical protein
MMRERACPRNKISQRIARCALPHTTPHLRIALRNSPHLPVMQLSRQPLLNREATVMYLVPSATTSAVAPQAAGMEELLALIPYARVTDLIRRYWGKDHCDEFLNSLLINDRVGDRQGFSGEIAGAIFALITLSELTRRRTGRVVEAVTSGDHDWANETGRWTIVKTPEAKSHQPPIAASRHAPYGKVNP